MNEHQWMSPKDAEIFDLLEKNKDLKAENEQLRNELDRFREGVQKIYDLVNQSNKEYAVQLVVTLQDIAQETIAKEDE